MNTSYFISDLHLSATRSDLVDAFITLVHDLPSEETDALYILGDLFEFWVGDDDKTTFNNKIQAELKQLVERGIPVYLVKGNRDFLIGNRFAKRTGVILLEDETVIDLYGKPTLLLHGDTLCTDDINYQNFRRKVNQPWLQWIFNCIPLRIRKRIIRKVQNEAKNDKSEKSLMIMDVNQQAVMDAFERNQVSYMIHGHTHRPKIHDIQIEEAQYQRIVLGDWDSYGYVLQINAQTSIQHRWHIGIKLRA